MSTVSDVTYGHVMSILVSDPAMNAPLLYDALEVLKGPSLGTNFTLCCPYTLIAHYHELDQVELQTGGAVSRWLLRVSVGCDEQSANLVEVF